jgi:hypothetical protein
MAHGSGFASKQVTNIMKKPLKNRKSLSFVPRVCIGLGMIAP